MDDLLSGLELFLSARNLAWVVLGCVAGFVVGAIPGVGPPNAAALILPFAIGMEPVESLILIASMYAGALFSGSIPAILINAPGEAGAAATALDGYPMARAGKAEQAIGIARMASTLGGVIAGVFVLLAIGPLGGVAREFGAREVFIIALLGLAVIAVTVGSDIRKGVMSALLGLLIAAMSANPMTGQARYHMGFVELYGALPFVAAIMGLFGVAQMLRIASEETLPASVQGANVPDATATGRGRALREAWSGIVTTLKYPVTIVRSSLIGLFIGIVPGVGAASATFISYGAARQFSPNGHNFGKGEPEGIVASETCDNAVASGTLIPTMALGIPGSATAAIMLAALTLHGIQPGPSLMATSGPLVYAVILGIILASILILPLGTVLSAPLGRIAGVRPVFLVPGVLLACVVGTYSVRYSLFDVGLLIVFGVLGFVMMQAGYPVVPLVLGLVLGPIAEDSLLRALQLSNGSFGYFFDSTTALILWGLLGAGIAYGVVNSVRTRKARRRTSKFADASGG